MIQPWLEGEAASLSLLCREGQAQLLSCNRQLIEVVDNGIRYRGSLLNGMAAHSGSLRRHHPAGGASAAGTGGLRRDGCDRR